jgi:hypothetical protein
MFGSAGGTCTSQKMGSSNCVCEHHVAGCKTNRFITEGEQPAWHEFQRIRGKLAQPSPIHAWVSCKAKRVSKARRSKGESMRMGTCAVTSITVAMSVGVIAAVVVDEIGASGNCVE